MYCVPAVNLFAEESEPVEVDHRSTEYRLVADVKLRDEVQIYSVDSVRGREYRTGTINEYQPLYALRLRRDGDRYYHTTRRDHGTGMPLAYITVGGSDQFEAESLSCDLTACNGHVPRQYLHEDQITVSTSDIPSGVKFRNITRPTPLWQPPSASEYPWRLNALLALNVGSFADRDALQQLLKLFDWTERADNAPAIEGVVGAEARPMNRMMHGILHRGLEITVSLQEEHFLSKADIYLLGQVLHQFFSLSANLNEFIQTRIVCQPSHQEFVWAPRLGQSSPL
ncbi:type VI secretion system baseplate subunit TssF [Alkalilimnicola ehrlichii]|uniref:type VI secretion system baseplate subunit TssF n=1 Tax=Alkalilimnicola ehrlichii TaxID=351052 RepID=UPI0015F27C43|nr:type VI secretion system baseplate subunit TssF [Alkalilimnicola ehrlichii]